MKKQGFSTTLVRGTEEMNKIAVVHQGFLQLLDVLASMQNLFQILHAQSSESTVHTGFFATS